MVFTKRLRDGVRRGTITCSVRVWTHPHVKVGGRYRMDDGEIEVDSIEKIARSKITNALARRSGFRDVAELMGVAQHGRGKNIYLIEFRYSPSFLPRQHPPTSARGASPKSERERATPRGGASLRALRSPKGES